MALLYIFIEIDEINKIDIHNVNKDIIKSIVLAVPIKKCTGIQKALEIGNILARSDKLLLGFISVKYAR